MRTRTKAALPGVGVGEGHSEPFPGCASIPQSFQQGTNCEWFIRLQPELHLKLLCGPVQRGHEAGLHQIAGDGHVCIAVSA